MKFARSSEDLLMVHSVNLIDIDKDAGLAKIINPWGRVETVDFDRLKERIVSANFNLYFFSNRTLAHMLSGIYW